MNTRDGERIKGWNEWSVHTVTLDFHYTYTAQGRYAALKARRPAVAPGTQWARSSAGVYLNRRRRKE